MTLLLSGTAVYFAAGCSKDTGHPTMLPPRKQFYVADIPVPAKFELNEKKSSHVYTAGRRSVKELYEGKSPPLTVRTFYVQHMPASGWQLTHDSLENNIYTLKYRKGEERCEIRIERVPAGLGSITRIWATIRSDNTLEFPAAAPG